MQQKYGMGVDIGGTKIIVTIVGADGQIVYRNKMKTTNDLVKIADLIIENLKLAEIDEEAILSVGFGVPGIVDFKKGVVLESPGLQWNEKAFITEISPYLKVPSFITNDVNCAAIGERWLGSAKGIKDYVFLSIGTGVGASIVAGGQFITGKQNMAGEVGYWLEADDVQRGKENRLGQFGVFEQKTSGTSLSQHGMTAEELFAEYERGNPVCFPIIDRFVLELSVCIANLSSLLNPEKVIIGGGVAQALPPLLSLLQLKVAELTPVTTVVELSELGEDAGAIGAAAYGMEQWKQGALEGEK
jgi:glucokinase